MDKAENSLDASTPKIPAANYTLHNTFNKICPRQTWHRFIARDLGKQEPTKEMAWGKHVHEALDNYLSHEQPMPANLKHHEHLYQFPRDFVIRTEVQLGIREDYSPCNFFDDEVWARGVLDLLIALPSRSAFALLIDHKTGKRREDPTELKFHAVLLKAHKPELTSIKGWYNWLALNQMGDVHDLSDTADMLEEMRMTQERIQRSFLLGYEAFPPRQSGLCPWCPCTFCEFHP